MQLEEESCETFMNAKIFKIVFKEGSNGDRDAFIGSTTATLEQTMEHHVKNYYREYKKMVYGSERLFDKYGPHHCKIELIEIFPCNSEEALAKRESEIVRKVMRWA
jgi:hypothetical protein